MTGNDWPTNACGCPALMGPCDHDLEKWRKRGPSEGPYARIRELQDEAGKLGAMNNSEILRLLDENKKYVDRVYQLETQHNVDVGMNEKFHEEIAKLKQAGDLMMRAIEYTSGVSLEFAVKEWKQIRSTND